MTEKSIEKMREEVQFHLNNHQEVMDTIQAQRQAGRVTFSRPSMAHLEKALRLRIDVIDELWKEKRQKELFEVIQFFHSACKLGGIYDYDVAFELTENYLATIIKHTEERTDELEVLEMIGSLYAIMPAWDLTGNDRIFSVGKELLNTVEKLYDNVLAHFIDKLMGKFKDQSPIIFLYETLGYVYLENLDELFKRIDEFMEKLSDKDQQAKNQTLMDVNKSLMNLHNNTRKEEAKVYADKILLQIEPTTPQEQELKKGLIEYNKLQEIGFYPSDFFAKNLPRMMAVKLDDKDMIKNKELVFEFYPLRTSTQTMYVNTKVIEELVGHLPLLEIGKMKIDTKKMQLKKEPEQGMIAILTQDSSGITDGILFMVSITSGTTIKLKENPERELKIPFAERLLFYGVLAGYTPLKRKQISLADYMNNWKAQTAIKKAKVYLLEIPSYSTKYFHPKKKE